MNFGKFSVYWAWVAVNLLLALALGNAELITSELGLDWLNIPEQALVHRAGWALGAITLLGAVAYRWVVVWFQADEPLAARISRRPYLTLFLVSLLTLFVELMLIRYCVAQVRIFSFYKNIPLIGAFLGLGLGCWLGHARVRHVLSFLLWLVPLTFFLAFGSPVIDGYLGRLAASASSEMILGDFVAQEGAGEELAGKLLMGLFCAFALVAITTLFTFVGRLLGDAFEQVPRIPGYTVNILASLAGVLAFVALSFLWTPPVVWYVLGLLPFLWWLDDRRSIVTALVLVLISSAAVVPGIGNVVWSSYQKLVGFEVPTGGVGSGSTGYLVRISDVFYQVALDLRPEAIGDPKSNPYPHYDAAFAGLEKLDRVLVVGAGTGNDVAAALRAGAGWVDAVDIDRAIVQMGEEHHPERPYDDPRVHLIIDDARSAFRYLPRGEYDAVVFGLLDSHSQLGMSSVRLDNYVFTMESLDSARRLLAPGGHLIVTAATFRSWFRDRFVGMLSSTCGEAVQVASFKAWFSYRCRVADPTAAYRGVPEGIVVPTDDWPFLYLPTKSIPLAYVVVVALLILVSLVVLRLGGLEFRRFGPYSLHLFFLGAAFLLMEVVAINRLALLFGTTWVVSAVAIALVLTLIVAANLTVLRTGGLPYGVAYGGLVLTLLVGFFVQPSLVLGRGPGVAVAYGFLVLLPIYFAGLVFARSFDMARLAGPAIGANILGAVLGGWMEYGTLALGIRAMGLVALVFYLASLLALLRSRELEVLIGAGESERAGSNRRETEGAVAR